MRPIPVVDGHNDLPWAQRLAEANALSGKSPDDSTTFRTDLPRLHQGGVAGQFWSVYVPASLEGSAAIQATLEQIARVHHMVETNPQHLALAGSTDQAAEAMGLGRIASFLGAEGGHSIGGSLAVLRMFHRLGVRYLTLTHNRNVGWADSCTDAPATGLSAFGEEVVRELNRLGMLVDLSHVAPETARRALEVSQAPVIFSHSSCQAICDHPRNVADDLLRQLPGNGGVLMVTFVPAFVSQACCEWDRSLTAELTRRGIPEEAPEATSLRQEWARQHPKPRATVEQVADHVEHAREMVGLDHIGLGGDFDGCRDYPVGLEDVSGYPSLMRVLESRGWSESELKQLGAGNILSALRGAEAVALAAPADSPPAPPTANGDD